MSIFGNAKKAKLKEEALDTKNWISDEEIYSVLDDQYDQLMGFESKLVSILQDESNDTPD